MAKKSELITEGLELDESNSAHGVSLADLRRAYFNKQVPEMLTHIQASGELNEVELKKVYDFWGLLREQETGLVDNVVKMFGGKIINQDDVPTVDELMKGIDYSPDEEERAMSIVRYVESVLSTLRAEINKVPRPKLSPTYWLDTVTTFLTYVPNLTRYYVYKSQMFHAEITRIIDDYGCSRLEAENRAKLSKAYADYKYLQALVGDMNLTGLFERFENLSKKWDAKN
jgi:hypothetical protein